EAVDARGLMEVARTVEQRQLEARDFGKARLTLERAEPVGPVDLTECSGTLIDELQLLPADREIPHLPGHDHLKHHRRLVRGAVKSGGSQKGDAIVEPEVPHQWVDPADRIGGAEGSILRTQDQVEAAPRARQAPFSDLPYQRDTQRMWGQAERRQRLFPREVGAAMSQPVLKVAFKGGHSQIICKS